MIICDSKPWDVGTRCWCTRCTLPWLLETTWHEENAFFPSSQQLARSRRQVSPASRGYSRRCHARKKRDAPYEVKGPNGKWIAAEYLFHFENMRIEFIGCFQVTHQLENTLKLLGGFAQAWKETARATKNRLLTGLKSLSFWGSETIHFGGAIATWVEVHPFLLIWDGSKPRRPRNRCAKLMF